LQIFALGVAPTSGSLHKAHLLEIAGLKDNVLIAKSGFRGLDATFSKKLSAKICGNRCVDRYRDEL